MTNMSIQPLWLTHFIEILLVLEFQLTKLIIDAFSYKAHFRPQISSNRYNISWLSQGRGIHVSQRFFLPYGIIPFKDEVLCDVAPLEVYDVLLG